MKKTRVFDALVGLLEGQLHVRKAAADTAREAATDDEARARSKYETQGLEASYLARGHALMLEELAEAYSRLKSYRLPAYDPEAPIGQGALVEVESDGEIMWFMILPGGGGTDIDLDGQEVTIITPETPLGAELIGKTAGQTYRLRPGGPGGAILSVR
jgi:transcription elongation GreA/GreB family factor